MSVSIIDYFSNILLAAIAWTHFTDILPQILILIYFTLDEFLVLPDSYIEIKKMCLTSVKSLWEKTGSGCLILVSSFLHCWAFWCWVRNILSKLGQYHGPLARYVKLQVAHAPGMPGTFSPPPQVNDPDMHHGTCRTHVPWCMPG